MLPLTFGSNVFVPTDTLPSWLRGFVEINPVTHVADAARGLLSGGPVAGPVTRSPWSCRRRRTKRSTGCDPTPPDRRGTIGVGRPMAAGRNLKANDKKNGRPCLDRSTPA